MLPIRHADDRQRLALVVLPNLAGQGVDALAELLFGNENLHRDIPSERGEVRRFHVPLF